MNVHDPSNNLYIEYFNSELSVETFSLLWCVPVHCVASNVQFFKPNDQLVNSYIAFRLFSY
jgi:hypothetical protein